MANRCRPPYESRCLSNYAAKRPPFADSAFLLTVYRIFLVLPSRRFATSFDQHLLLRWYLLFLAHGKSELRHAVNTDGLSKLAETGMRDGISVIARYLAISSGRVVAGRRERLMPEEEMQPSPGINWRSTPTCSDVVFKAS